MEPEPRNTAPAALTAALQFVESDPDKLMVLLPSDHAMDDVAGFQQSLKVAMEPALDGAIVVFGVKPTGPETGYGYIETKTGDGVLDVIRFVEKPDQKTAETYIQSEDFYWNAGIFMFTAGTMVAAFNEFRPEMVSICRQAIKHAVQDLDFLRIDQANYAQCENISLDYAIIEKARNLCCVPLAGKWNDIGSWSAVWQSADKSIDGNAAHGDVQFHDARNCYGRSQDGACLVFLGLENVSAIATKDAIVVMDSRRSQEIRNVVDQLRETGNSNITHHMRVYRPWGWYEVLDRGEKFQVKRLMVSPGQKLSLQAHRHRAEHWVVVRGTVLVTIDGEKKLLNENQSTYIALGARHQLENPGSVASLLIEVQSGGYLEEDDIIHFEEACQRQSGAD